MDSTVEMARNNSAPVLSGANLRARAGLKFFKDDAGSIVFLPKNGHVSSLNQAATLLFLLCDGSMSSKQIVSIASKLTSDGSTATAECIESYQYWLDNAEQDGLILRGSDKADPLVPITAKDLKKLTRHLYEEGMFAEARRCALSLVHLKPNSPKAWQLLGDAEHDLKHFDQAKTAYEEYLKLRPDDAIVAHLVVSLSNTPAPKRAPSDCVKQTFDQFAESFDSTLGDLEYKAPELIAERLAGYLPKPDKQLDILDLGCGTGLMGKSISPWARELCGIDLSHKMAAKALLTDLYQEMHIAEIESWLKHYRNNTFDLILAADVLVYFGDLTEVFSTAKRLLNREGKFAFTLEKGDKPGFDLTVSGRYAHNEDYIRNLAASNGYRVVHFSAETPRYESGKKVDGHLVILSAEPLQ